MAAALVGVPRDDHVRHHIVDAHAFLFEWVGDNWLEELEEDGVF
jgi:hypothetical protein